jgi:hypothetical protein
VSYYLSRFDTIAYQNLGFGNKSETHNRIGEILNINPLTIRNWRDEFDPYFGHRLGWHQVKLRPTLVYMMEALQDMDEPEVKELVMEVLYGGYEQKPENLENLLTIMPVEDTVIQQDTFILRTPTGRKAEDFFIEYFRKNEQPVSGKLIDTRDLGVGYDFKIIADKREYYIKVKGTSEVTGGVLFTTKEWEMAKQNGDSFFLAIVADLNNIPVIKFIQNPAMKLAAKKSIVKVIQINWAISNNEIDKVLA